MIMPITSLNNSIVNSIYSSSTPMAAFLVAYPTFFRSLVGCIMLTEAVLAIEHHNVAMFRFLEYYAICRNKN